MLIAYLYFAELLVYLAINFEMNTFKSCSNCRLTGYDTEVFSSPTITSFVNPSDELVASNTLEISGSVVLVGVGGEKIVS